MFQTFDSAGDPSHGKERVAKLRAWMAQEGLDGFLVPRADEHQGEYVPPSAERLRWLTGFSGSAGVAVILRDRAAVFVDGRYTLQVRQQVDLEVFGIESLIDNPPPSWLRDNLAMGARLGFDPWLHTIADAAALRAAAEKAGALLVPVSRNGVDAIWEDRPEAPLSKVELHPQNFAGELAKDKLVRLARAISGAGATHAVLTDPSSIAWAFNIRGNDVPHTPLALAFAILAADGTHRLFIDERKLGRTEAAYLTQLAELRAPGTLEATLRELSSDGASIALDPSLAAERLRLVVEEAGGVVVPAADPARLPRAAKNPVEIAGSRAAHRRDGAAIARYLCWLDAQAAGSIDEIKAVTQLEDIRRATGEETQMPLRDVSFDTISGAGPNGAIMHYRVSHATSRRLEENELFLVDSGAQYQDGTTDITRTVIVGQPTEEMRAHYTLVLKGLIGLSALRFPKGIRGQDIDTVARMALWKRGLDYAHGTGHGVGSYLAVHEGPQRIARTGTERLVEGMIVSNEPGYYKEGHYGIRLENLILVTAPETIEGGEIAMHGFETLTLAPFDRRLIAVEMLSREELDWLNAYHDRVLGEIGPMVDGETFAWLEKATSPLS